VRKTNDTTSMGDEAEASQIMKVGKTLGSTIRKDIGNSFGRSHQNRFKVPTE